MNAQLGLSRWLQNFALDGDATLEKIYLQWLILQLRLWTLVGDRLPKCFILKPFSKLERPSGYISQGFLGLFVAVPALATEGIRQSST